MPYNIQQQKQQNNQKVMFRKWALEPELCQFYVLQKYNWTQTALHHHMLNESPKALFLHWTVTGDVLVN